MAQTKQKNNKMSVRIIALIIGFLVNSIGNSLTIVSNMGAEPWTATAVNLSKLAHKYNLSLSIGTFVIAFGIFYALFNQAVISRIRHKKLGGKTKIIEDAPMFWAEVFYIFVFGKAIDAFTALFEKWGLNSWGAPSRIAMSIIGVTMFCSAISVYQRANLFMHPNDHTSNLIRFVYSKGSAVLSQTIDIVPALLFAAIAGIFLGHIYSISIGTIYSIIFNGIIIKYSDKYIWPSLIHNKKK